MTKLKVEFGPILLQEAHIFTSFGLVYESPMRVKLYTV